MQDEMGSKRSNKEAFFGKNKEKKMNAMEVIYALCLVSSVGALDALARSARRRGKG